REPCAGPEPGTARGDGRRSARRPSCATSENSPGSGEFSGGDLFDLRLAVALDAAQGLEKLRAVRVALGAEDLQEDPEAAVLGHPAEERRRDLLLLDHPIEHRTKTHRFFRPHAQSLPDVMKPELHGPPLMPVSGCPGRGGGW